MPASKLTKNGVSTTTKPGQFAYEPYNSAVLEGERVQWDYRDKNGKLHSGIAKTLEEAKAEARKFGYEG
jgi:hypothetical protein